MFDERTVIFINNDSVEHYSFDRDSVRWYMFIDSSLSKSCIDVKVDGFGVKKSTTFDCGTLRFEDPLDSTLLLDEFSVSTISDYEGFAYDYHVRFIGDSIVQFIDTALFDSAYSDRSAITITQWHRVSCVDLSAAQTFQLLGGAWKFNSCVSANNQNQDYRKFNIHYDTATYHLELEMRDLILASRDKGSETWDHGNERGVYKIFVIGTDTLFSFRAETELELDVNANTPDRIKRLDKLEWITPLQLHGNDMADIETAIPAYRGIRFRITRDIR